MGLVAQLWPVYRWDDSPRVLALIVPRAVALDELNRGSEPLLSDSELSRALRTRITVMLGQA
jgi:hypothetical protein